MVRTGNWVLALVVIVAVPVAIAQTPPRSTIAGDAGMKEKRQQMVSEQIEPRGIRDPRVLDAMRQVERHRFIPDAVRDHAYDDDPLRIGYGQTISQPYMVALMTETLAVAPGQRVLEVGTGCGYQTAVLSLLVAHVYSMELVEPLATAARARLNQLGYENVTVRAGDGYLGWPEEAPFDRIIVTAAPPSIPPALVEQLADGGRMVLPLGTDHQELILVEKHGGVVTQKSVVRVRFVPMVRGEDNGKKR